ncbi:MAG: UvrD-helicase domain-containing protein [Parachlamydiaceae bacterium]|nr:UvrD-helicase domain-containing protein [Parachlamydiaceae bacterium]
MKRFDVLDRSQNLQRNYLLEASAGTGKTFAIENIVVRLLLDREDLPIERILVVTFTRAATRDLKMRIRQNIQKALTHLKTRSPSSPDYLKAYFDKDEQSIYSAIRRLEHALFCFDQAQIFTIHGFCSRMLRDHLFEGGMAANACGSEETLNDSLLRQVIRDFFRTELKRDIYSDTQLQLVLQAHDNSLERLENKLIEIVKMGVPIEPQADFNTLYQKFLTCMESLKQQHEICSERLIADFLIQAPQFKNIADRTGTVKSEIMAKVQRLGQLFDQDKWSPADFNQLLADGLILTQALDPSQRKVKSKEISPTELHYPMLLDSLRAELDPIVRDAGHPLLILARMAEGCRLHLQRVLIEEERLSFDDLLKTMGMALKNPKFTQKVQHAYSAAIIDEFQDTDPLQWTIFKTLFIDRNAFSGHLYLVGDPKQSIYAFRQADIYTYLAAAEAMGSDYHASLDTNFRSQPSLVHALNHLFSAQSCPGMIHLPQIDKILEYPLVKASDTIAEYPFLDPLGSVHFCLSKPIEKSRVFPLEACEEQHFFPYFAAEIQRLHSIQGMRYQQFAILVSDRFQAERLTDYLKQQQIPVISQRSSSLADSPTLQQLRSIMQATLHPKRESAVKTALGSRLLGWNDDLIKTLEIPAVIETILSQFYHLRSQWRSHGFTAFFHSLLNSSWTDDGTSVFQSLLKQERGDLFLEELQQLANILMEEEQSVSASPEGLISLLDKLALMNVEEEERLKKRFDSARDAVNILTLHASKGLEFDVVFALGLIKRSKATASLIPLSHQGNMRLHPVVEDTDPAYQAHCRELDAEKMRQLYVAMTRAKYRLYVPVIFSSAKIPEPGCASPMELFLARLGQHFWDPNTLYERIAAQDDTHFCEFLKKTSCHITYTYLKNEPPASVSIEKPPVPLLIPPVNVVIPGTPTFMHSFTTLSQGHTSIAPSGAPHTIDDTVKNPQTLPAGSETGNVLHQILESIDFAIPNELLPIIRPYLKGTHLVDWEEVICTIVYNALKTPLNLNGQLVALEKISKQHRYQEMEFLYPYDGFDEIEEMKSTPGFLKGVIDLLFMHDGKYYLLDWKSNWLPSYEQEQLEACMTGHNYFLQAKIYKEALRRYLKLVDDRPFEEIFGGTFYLFLRGNTVFNFL